MLPRALGPEHASARAVRQRAVPATPARIRATLADRHDRSVTERLRFDCLTTRYRTGRSLTILTDSNHAVVNSPRETTVARYACWASPRCPDKLP